MRFEPAVVVLPPYGELDVQAVFSGGGSTGSFRGLVRVMVDGGECVTYVGARAEVQAPRVEASCSKLLYGVGFLGVPESRTFVLRNKSALGAEYSVDAYAGMMQAKALQSINEVMGLELQPDDSTSAGGGSRTGRQSLGPDGMAMTVSGGESVMSGSTSSSAAVGGSRVPPVPAYMAAILPGERGNLEGMSSRELVVALTPTRVGPMSGVLAVDVTGVSRPIGVEFKGIIRGLSVAFAVLSERGCPLALDDKGDAVVGSSGTDSKTAMGMAVAEERRLVRDLGLDDRGRPVLPAAGRLAPTVDSHLRQLYQDIGLPLELVEEQEAEEHTLTTMRRAEQAARGRSVPVDDLRDMVLEALEEGTRAGILGAGRDEGMPTMQLDEQDALQCDAWCDSHPDILHEF